NVYCITCWWSDKWDPKSYGREYDFKRPFMEQYRELHQAMPKLAMMNDNGISSENCEYTYDFAYGKNCYLVVASWFVENCMYGYLLAGNKDSADNLFLFDSQLMYNTVDCKRCYNCRDCFRATDSSDCILGFDLKNCKDCILCSGLRGQQYCIRNKQYTKEEFEAFKKEMGLDSWKNMEKYRSEFAEFIKQTPRKYSNFLKCEDCTGDNLESSKNSKECYNTRNIQDCKWFSFGDGGKDSYDVNSTGQPELCYDSVTPDNSYSDFFTVYCWKCQFVCYSENCHSSNNLFGCVGLRKGEFCILNKQYSKEEYLALREKIVEQMETSGEWGEFFPSNICLFAYNETMANEKHPLDEAGARQLGYRWTAQLPGVFGKKALDWTEVPDSISEVGADGLVADKTLWKEVLSCTKCQRNFKLIEKEFAFYKARGIPVPRRCSVCRDLERKEKFNPRKMYDRQCDCAQSGHEHADHCPTPFQTTYAPDRPEKVYCEKCYNQTLN
ncbi:hypothetical protein HY224_02960, partial [Candidatus Uhrbacteria bacterium]|nr:hypothetical protein [Candidatus Uhrbacteria bacterium]